MMKANLFMRPRFLSLALIVVIATSACRDRAAPTDTLALIDGQPLTRSDVAADFSARHLLPGGLGAVSGKLEAAVVTALIDRKLLAARARLEEVDRQPNYAPLAARAQEVALVELLLDKWRTGLPASSKAAVQLFMDRNPQIFSERKIYYLDTVQVDRKGIDQQFVSGCPSMDAVINYLRERDQPFQRGSSSLDTMTAGLPLARRIAALPAGKPFVVTRGSTLVIGAVVRSTAAPLANEQGFRVASRLVQGAQLRQYIKQQVTALRAATKVTYIPAVQ